MKYIYAIIGLAVLVTAGTWMALRPDRTPEGEPVLIVNDRRFSQKEFDDRLAGQPYQTEDRENFADTLVLRELLIQEARRRGIDQEEPFRWSVQHFYEQSLIKVLMDRRYEELRADAESTEIDRYVRFVNHKVVLSEFTLKTDAERAHPATAQGRSITERFEFLSENVRWAISSLDPGQFTQPLRQDEYEIVYRLDGIVMEGVGTDDVDREAIRRVIAEQKTSAAIEQWMQALKTSARIERRFKKGS